MYKQQPKLTLLMLSLLSPHFLIHPKPSLLFCLSNTRTTRNERRDDLAGHMVWSFSAFISMEPLAMPFAPTHPHRTRPPNRRLKHQHEDCMAELSVYIRRIR